MKKEVKVGKYTLESLTTGMYSNPRIIYREYIQNSVDSIEEAISQQLITLDESKIEIIIDDEENKISIFDNGVGIRTVDSFNTLTNIGNSKKKYYQNRGFRGIGRLAGLSYCSTLRFITSCSGEAQKSIVEFDCVKLKRLLVPGEHDEYDLSTVINEVVSFSVEEEEVSSHYFIVEMEDIDNLSGLLDIDDIKKYLKQTLPLPYKRFIWKSKIYEMFKENDIELTEFNILLGNGIKKSEQLFKSNSDKFEANKKRKEHDELDDIVKIKVEKDGKLLALGWYGECNFYGQITNSEISGIRVRKGNILIGDNRTLNSIFKENRFNSYVQGELFVISDGIIPNARRDDFEQNEEYYYLIKELKEKVGDVIQKKIREASTKRNSNLSKRVDEANREIKKAKRVEEEGFNSKVEKDAYIAELEKKKKELEKVKPSNNEEEVQKKNIIGELDKTLENVGESNNYKVGQIKSIGKDEKRVLKIVTDILSTYLEKQVVDMMIDEVKEKLEKGKK